MGIWDPQKSDPKATSGTECDLENFMQIFKPKFMIEIRLSTDIFLTGNPSPNIGLMIRDALSGPF